VTEQRERDYVESALRRCTHQSFPFAEAATKSKIARRLPAQAGSHIAPFAAPGVGYVPVLATRDEDIHGEWIGLGAHFFQSCLGFMKRCTKVVQRVLKAICDLGLHCCHIGERTCFTTLLDYQITRRGHCPLQLEVF
jgi:hypothetical protein